MSPAASRKYPLSVAGIDYPTLDLMNGLPSLAWHAIVAEQVAREVASDPRAGLSAAEAAARTAAVSVIVVGEIFYLFSSRALLRPAWAVPLSSNMWLWAGIAAMLAVQFAFAHTPIVNRLFHTAPLDASAWTRILLVGAGVLVVVESEKAIRRATAKTMVADSA